MFQLRRILLSGLVALLMVGMVSAGELNYLDDGGDKGDALPRIGIRAYFGAWVDNACIEGLGYQCLSIKFTFYW